MNLLEIMVVVIIIGIISGIVGINVKGSIDRAKKTQTELASEKIKNALMLAVAEGISVEEACQHPEKALQNSPLLGSKSTREITKMLNDGWGKKFIITHKNGEVFVKSESMGKKPKNGGSIKK